MSKRPLQSRAKRGDPSDERTVVNRKWIATELHRCKPSLLLLARTTKGEKEYHQKKPTSSRAQRGDPSEARAAVNNRRIACLNEYSGRPQHSSASGLPVYASQ